MKKYINRILPLFVAFALTQSCEYELKTIDYVTDNTERGAVLRTIEIPSSTFDFYNTSSEWVVTLEAQDIEDGRLMENINVYSAFVNDGNIGPEVLIKTVPATEFAPGPFGFPRGDVTLTLQEVIDAANLESGDYDSGDSFNVRLESVLKDGRIFTNSNTVGTISGGSFFSSPFFYSVQFFCALEDASDFSGNYIVNVDEWEDYAPGDIIPVEYVSDYTFRILGTANPYITNGDVAYMEVTINPTDGSATMVTNTCFQYDGWDCLDFTGRGTVGTCTGDINLTVTYGSYGDGAFSLVKQ